MTVIQTISTIIGIITGVLAIIATISALTKKKRDERQAKFLRDVIKPLTDPIESKIDAIETKVNDNERDRLRGVILNLASRLRAGDIVTDEEYRDCIYCHDKYEQLGGNGQVREAYSLIEEHFHQRQLDEIQNNQDNHQN